MLFSGIRCSLSPTLPEQRQNELSKLLEANGARMVDFPDASHVITNTLQFEGQERTPQDVQLVTDEWVDRSIVQGKLQEAKYFSADPIMIFSGVVACVADLEPCDTEVIAAGINALGGLFREGYTRDCTHVLAARPDSDKYLTAMHYASATRVKVVLPHWFDDCFKLLVRLSEDPYLWPDPPLLRTNYALSKARLAPSTKALVKAAILEEEPAGKIAVLGRSENNIWNGKRILLSSSLRLENGRREAVEASVKRAGGVIIQPSGDEVADVDSADVYVTLYRLGSAFVKAVRANVTVGTLSWLFSVHKSSILTSPLDQLLHFPSSRPPLPGFENHKITATNYEGDARRYLKKLIELMGGSFTPQMTAQNTVVVAAYIKGEKSTKAREWNIPIVNHTWLEDCFATWTHITPAQEKYVSFPPGVNFGDIVCKRSISPLTDEELAEIETFSSEAERLEKDKTATEQAKSGEADEANASQGPRIWDTSCSSPTRPTDVKFRNDSGEGRGSPLKPAGARLNIQQTKRREEEQKEEEDEDIQPPRARGRPTKRGRESDDEGDLDAEPRRGRVQPSPAKRATRFRARSDIGSDDKDGSVPQTRGMSTRRAPTPAKASPSKSGATTKDVRVEDDADGESKAVPSKERVVAARWSKGRHKSALEAMNDDEFSDEDSSPIMTSNNLPIEKAAAKTRPNFRAKYEEEEEEEEDEENISPRKLRHPQKKGAAGPSRVNTVGDELNTPSRKHYSVPGPTPGKHVIVEIPSQKSSSQLSRTRADTAAIADVTSDLASPKRGRLAPRTPTKKQEQENDRPASSPNSAAESPSRSAHFSSEAIRLSSQPTPIIPSTALQRTPSKRRAASKASAKLHENALDIIKFEKEKRSGRFRGAWEDGREKTKIRSASTSTAQEEKGKLGSSTVRPSESDAEEETVKSNRKKRKSENGEKSADAGKKAKKPRISNPVSEGEEESEKESEEGMLDGSDIRLMTTQVTLSDSVLKGLRRLGVKMASKPTECTLLLANNIGRTEKFLCAMATAQSIVTEAWAVDSVKAKRILPPDNYFLKDPDGEKKHKFKLAEALQRAHSSSKKLLDGHTFYFTKSLHRSEKLATYKNIIHSAGGKVVLQNPTVRILRGHLDRHVLTVEGDKLVTDPLKDEGFHIYVPEFILMGILTQRMDWDTTPHRLR